MLWRFLMFIIFCTSSLASDNPLAPIERQHFCNYQIDYFGNIYNRDGSKFETISNQKTDEILKNCWDPVFQNKYFFNTALRYKYSTTNYYVDNYFFKTQSQPVNFDLILDSYYRHKKIIIFNVGSELFFNFPIPDFDYTTNLSAFYGVDIHIGALFSIKYLDLQTRVGLKHLIVASSLTTKRMKFMRDLLPYLSLEGQKRIRSIVLAIGGQTYASSSSNGTEHSVWLKATFEPPTSQIQVTITPYFNYALQSFNQTSGKTQQFGLELGYRF